MNLLKKQETDIGKLAKDYEIKALLLYGSSVKYENWNDVDICYIRDKKLTFEELLKVLSELCTIFKNDKIDLGDWMNASSLLKNEIALNHQILFGEKEYVYNYLHAGQRMFWDDKKYYDALKQKMKQESQE